MTWWDELKREFREEIGVKAAMEREEEAGGLEAAFLRGQQSGLEIAIDILEFYERQMEPDA